LKLLRWSDEKTLEIGKLRKELGQLEGCAYKPSAPTRGQSDSTKDRAKVEWVVRAPLGSKVKLLARHEVQELSTLK
jgi:hypothetical protein